VRDTGIGIAPDRLPHFELFVQGGSCGTGSQAGLGIGLALVKNLVEVHRGTVEAEFVVRLPLSTGWGQPEDRLPLGGQND
jgi:signal transduction histidine kinase